MEGRPLTFAQYAGWSSADGSVAQAGVRGGQEPGATRPGTPRVQGKSLKNPFEGDQGSE